MEEQYKKRLTYIVSKMKIGEWRRLYGKGGLAMWVTPCTGHCGTPMLSWLPRQEQVFRCDACRAADNKGVKELKQQISELTKLRRIADARKNIERQFGDTKIYEPSFRAIEKCISNPGWFQSASEVLAAAELLRTKTKVLTRVEYGRWKVDFVLPDLKVLLEVDGNYHTNPSRIALDKKRDAEIMRIVGYTWTIIRVKDDVIKRDLQSLISIIKKRLSKRFLA